jgi:hypothetical protein
MSDLLHVKGKAVMIIMTLGLVLYVLPVQWKNGKHVH